MNTIKRTLTSTKTLVATSIIGLIMALSVTTHGQAMDAAPEAPAVEATESSSDAGTVATPPAAVDAPAAPETEAEVAPAGDEAPAVENPAKEDPIGTGKGILQSLKDGKWLVAFGGVLLFLVFLIRWALVSFKVAWAETKPGGFIIAFGTSFALALGIAFQTGIGLSFSLLVGAAGAAWLAAGQHGHIKDVLDWLRKS